MKKVKLPGENISLKTKKTEDPLVMQWLNTQSNLMDSLRYLMEKEISEHGVRNLQAYIPMERNMLSGSSDSASSAMAVPSLAHTSAVSQLETAATSERKVNSSPAVSPSAAGASSSASSAAEAEEEELDDDDIEAWI